VTQAVHAKGGRIYMQIWHAGRAAHPEINAGQATVSSSATAIEGDIHTPVGKLPHAVPRALTPEEIPAIVAAYAQGAKNAIAAGFDGVEVHGANGCATGSTSAPTAMAARWKTAHAFCLKCSLR
jgi:N-ethylmaleimide reductase